MARLPKDNVLPIQRVTVRNSEKVKGSIQKALEFLEYNSAEELKILNFVNTSKEWEYLTFILGDQNPENITLGDLGNFYKLENGEVSKLSILELPNPKPISEEEKEEEVIQIQEEVSSILKEKEEYEILNSKTKKELLKLANWKGIQGVSRKSKEELILAIMDF